MVVTVSGLILHLVLQHVEVEQVPGHGHVQIQYQNMEVKIAQILDQL